MIEAGLVGFPGRNRVDNLIDVRATKHSQVALDAVEVLPDKAIELVDSLL